MISQDWILVILSFNSPIWKTYEFTNCKLIPFVDDDDDGDDESRLNLSIEFI